jgi:hypothetical protein
MSAIVKLPLTLDLLLAVWRLTTPDVGTATICFNSQPRYLGRFFSLVLPMSNQTQVTVLYGENKLQKTISLPASATIATAKKFGSQEILEHIHHQPGVPTDISLDYECTDFYPGIIHSPSMIYIY